MESEAVAAVRRRLESHAREHVERLELASKQLAETRKRTEEANAKFVHDVHRLVQRLRESNAARKAAGKNGGTLSFTTEDAEPEEEFAGPVVRPQRPDGGHDEEETGSFLQRVRERPQPPPVPQPAEPPRQTPASQPPPRRVPPRPPAVNDSDDDFSGQSWLR